MLHLSACLSKFITLVRLFHDGMEALVKVENLEPEPFKVSRRVKQGCVLAPFIFNIYTSYITRLLLGSIRRNYSARQYYRTDRSLLDHQKLKVRTKIKKTWFRELQYAYNCALRLLLTFTPSWVGRSISRKKKFSEVQGVLSCSSTYGHHHKQSSN